MVRRMVVAIAFVSMIWAVAFVMPVASYAVGLPTGSVSEQSAVLVGPKSDSPVPLYLRPAANQPSVGYGTTGRSVTVLEQIASFLPEADQGSAWNHVRLDDAPYTEGWIQGRFLAIEADVQSGDEIAERKTTEDRTEE